MGGHFDYLADYCKVTYLERTQGVSSTEIRSLNELRVGLVGYTDYMNRVLNECKLVNGLRVVGICTNEAGLINNVPMGVDVVTTEYRNLIDSVDAVYIHSHPDLHYEQVKAALLHNKHVMCESPIAKSLEQCQELFELADSRGLVLMDSLRTAYSTAYARMPLLIKGGRIGDVVSVDATCTNLKTNQGASSTPGLRWSSVTTWGPTALLPSFQILGAEPLSVVFSSRCPVDDKKFDEFSRIALEYENAVATVKVGAGVKSEGSLVVSGTKGYVYVPAPWWKTEYFEIRYENPADNKRYFYQLDGEGIRFEWVRFVRIVAAVDQGTKCEEVALREGNIERKVSLAICDTVGKFEQGFNVRYLGVI